MICICAVICLCMMVCLSDILCDVSLCRNMFVLYICAIYLCYGVRVSCVWVACLCVLVYAMVCLCGAYAVVYRYAVVYLYGAFEN